MMYTVGEIILALILAAVIGFVLGWLLRGLSLRRRIEAQYETEVAHRQTRIVELEADLRDARTRADALEAEVGAVASDMGEQKALGTTLEARLAEAETASTELTSGVQKLTEDLAERDGKIARLESTLEAAPDVAVVGELEALAASLQGEVTSRDGEIEGLTTKVARLESTLEAAPDVTQVDDLTRAVDGLRDDVADRDARITELEERLEIHREPLRTETPDADAARTAMAEIANRTAGDEPAPDDDLKKIYGIGPKIEGLLKELGITSFRQIAHLSDSDIDLVATALGSFPDRMRRDDWMSGAADAHQDKYGTAP